MLWDFKSKFYDKVRNLFFLSKLLKKENEVVTEFLQNIPFENKKILDIGTGTGNVPVLLKKANWVVGADISFEMLVAARKKKNELIVINCNISKLPLAKGCIYLLSCVGVMEYLSDFKTLLSEISRVLQNDSYLYLTFSQKNFSNILRNTLGEKIHFVQEEKIIQELKSYGFKLVKKNTTFIQTQLLLRRGF